MYRRCLALLLCAAMIVGLMPARRINAAGGDTPSFVQIDGKYYIVEAAADPATDTPPVGGADGRFKTEGGDGRVWTDKTVRVNSSKTVPSFDVTLSTVGQVYESVEEGSATVQNRGDVLLILDNTVSMAGADGTDIIGADGKTKQTREKTMVDAANESLEIIFSANKENRVEVLVFDGYNPSNFKVLLPLDSYTPGNNGKYLTENSTSKSTSFNISVATGVKNSKGTTVSGSGASKQSGTGTYTQGAIYYGINHLIGTIDKEMGTGKTRATTKITPYVFLLTDGAANAAYNNTAADIIKPQIADGKNNTVKASGSVPTVAQQQNIIPRTILTAAYWKDQLTAKYRDYNPLVGGKNDSSIETQFFTVGLSTDASDEYAPVLLAPKLLLETYSEDGNELWNKNSNVRKLKDSVQINVKDYNLSTIVSNLNSLATGELAAYAPKAGNKFIYTTDSYYYQATTESGLSEAFADLANAVKKETRKVTYPVVFDPQVTGTFGGVTITDTLGAGMDVTADAATSFTATVGTGASAKTYTLSYNSAKSDASAKKFVYTTADEKLILIVDKKADPETVTWEVSAEVLPLFDKVRNGDSVSYTDVSPIKLTYNVRPTEDALKAAAAADGILYCSDFNSGASKGIAESTYEPQPDNPHFYVKQTDGSYIIHERFGNKNLVNVAKTVNTTNTASNAGECNFTGADKLVTNYLGNNGKLTLTPVPGEYTDAELTLKKTDAATSTGTGLSGAEFSLVKSGEASGENYKTKSDGTAAISFTEPGVYTLTETKAPTGYVKNSTVYTITVEASELAEPVYDSVSGEYVSKGSLIIKSVRTGSPAADSADYADNKLTVKNSPVTVDISGEKTWADSDFTDLDGYERPEEIEIKLVEVSGGTETLVEQTGLVNPVKVSPVSGKWSFSFEALPKYRDGVKLEYKVIETDIAGYTSEVTGYDVKNTLTPGEDDLKPVTVTVKKVDSVTKNPLKGAVFTIFEADGTTEFKKLDATGADGTASYTFSKDSDQGTYVIKETEAPEGYKMNTAAYVVVIEKVAVSAEKDADTGLWRAVYQLTAGTPDGAFPEILTVEDETKTTGLTLTKVWDDDSDRDGRRPDAVSFHLSRQIEGGAAEFIMDGSEKKVYTIGKPQTASNTWTLTLDGEFPTHKDGKPYVYSIIELDADGEEITSTGTYDEYYDTPAYKEAADGNKTIAENSHTPSTVEVKGTKTWRDTESTKRPAKITVKLVGKIGNEVVVEDTVDTDASEDWKYAFTDLYQYKDGKEIKYTVEELTVDGYEPVVDGYDITNIELMSISGSKTWSGDTEFADVTRPDSLVITLYQGTGSDKTKVGDSLTVTAEDGWSWKFDGLRKYDVDGNLITYSITEDAVKGYSAEVDGYDVTNTVETAPVVNSIDLSILKKDALTGGALKGVEFRLLKDGAAVPATAETDAAGAASFTITEEGTYILTETAPAGYQDGKTYTVTVIKTLAKTEYDEDAGKWVPTYELSIESVKEGSPLAASSDFTADATGKTGTLNITNTPKSEEVTFTKVWADGSDAAEKRPASVKYQLYKSVDGGTAVKVEGKIIELSGSGNTWTKVESLPAVEDGKSVSYSVRELEETDDDGTVTVKELAEGGVTKDGYKVSYSADGLSATNTLRKTFSVTKIWDDTGFEAIRPAGSVNFKLYKTVNGVTDDGEGYILVKGASGAYSLTLELPAYELVDGTEYPVTYSVKETVNGTAVEEGGASAKGYTVSYSEDAAGLVITNTLNGEEKYTPVGFVLKKVDLGTDTGIGLAGAVFTLTKQGGEETEFITGSGMELGEALISVPEAGTYTLTEKTAPTGYKKGDSVYTIVVKQDTAHSVFSYNTQSAKYTKTTPLLLDSIKKGDTVCGLEGGLLTVDNEATTIDLPVKKLWDDGDDQDGIRPEEVEIKLYQKIGDGEVTEADQAPLKLNEGNSWKGSFDGLIKYVDGEEIKYSIKETKTGFITGSSATGYAIDITGDEENGYTVTNIHKLETVEIAVSKIWADGGASDALRPTSIEVELYADGIAVSGKKLTLNAANSWKDSFKELDKYKGGDVIVYTVKEAAASENDNYDCAISGDAENGYVLTNTQKKTFSVTKVWEDEGFEAFRPTGNISFKLYKTVNGVTAEVGAYELQKSEAYTKSFELPAYELVSGKAYAVSYSVKETLDGAAVEEGGVSAKGYTVSYSEDAAGLVITNTVDKEEKDTPIGFTLKKEDLGTVTGTGLAGAVFTLTKQGGEGVDYTTGSGTDLGKVLISITEAGTYTLTEKTAPTGYKKGDSVYTIVVEQDTANATIAYNSETGKYVRTTPLVIDSIKKGDTVCSLEDGLLTVDNEATTIDLTVEKLWEDENDQDGIRPEEVEIKLYQKIGDGEVTEADQATLKLNEGNNWNGSFDGLIKYVDGVEIKYSIEEIKTGVINGSSDTGYAIDITGDEENGFTVTNTHKPATVEIAVSKTWVDGGASDTLRPTSIEVELYADGAAVSGKKLTLSAENGWQGSFKELDKFKAGSLIVYTVKEAASSENDNYDCAISGDAENGYVLTNTQKKTFSVTKIWADAGFETIRPAGAVSFKLYKTVNGTAAEVGAYELQKDGSGAYTRSFELPAYELVSGQAYAVSYSVKETAGGAAVEEGGESAPGYTVSYSEDAAGLVITNTVEKEEKLSPADFTLKKVDLGTDTGIGLAGAVYTLTKQGGEGVDYTTGSGTDLGKVLISITEAGTYTLTEKTAPKGYKIADSVYTIVVAEDPANAGIVFNSDAGKYVKTTPLTITSVKKDGEDCSLSEAVLTVGDLAETIDIDVTKVWEDGNDKDGIRPESVEIRLIRKIGEVEKPVTGKALVLTEDVEWKGTFTDLPKYVDGEEASYSVYETETTVITGYDGTGTYAYAVNGDEAEGYTVTNTHTAKEDPKMGDRTNSGLWTAMFVCSVSGMAMLNLQQKKKKEQEEG